MPVFAFPTVGPLGLSSPPSRVATLAPPIGTMLRYDFRLSISAASLVARHTDTSGCYFVFVYPLAGLAGSQ